MIITLSGQPGAGKTTLKNLLAEKLGMKSYSMGDVRSKMAIEKNLTVDELNKLGMTDPTIDHQIDEYQTKISETEDNFIVDGLLSWRFIPKSLKVFLAIDPAEGARRVFESRLQGDDRGDEPEYKNVEETQQIIGNRIKQNQARYFKIYGIDPMDQANYDLIINTTSQSPEQIVTQILDRIQ